MAVAGLSAQRSARECARSPERKTTNNGRQAMNDGKTSGRCHVLRFAIAIFPMAHQLPMSIGFKRLWTLGLLGAWLSIFAANAHASPCSYDIQLKGYVCDPPVVSITSPANGATY